MADGAFIRYSDGYQYYTEGGFLTQIHYPKNHFVSVVERDVPSAVKGIFGYGGHIHIDEIEGVTVENVENTPMWCEVVHERNMINDANILFGTKVVRDKDRLRRDFALDVNVDARLGVYAFKFLPRYLKTFVKRARRKFKGLKG